MISGLGRSPGEGKATHFSILAWRIPWTEEPGGLQFWGLQNQTQLSHSYTHTHTHALLQIPLASRLPHKIQLSSMCYILYFNFLSLSRVQLFVTPWTVTYQAPPFMGFSRQEYWSGCHLFLQEIFPIQGLNPGLLHCSQTLYHLRHQGSPNVLYSRSLLVIILNTAVYTCPSQTP